MRDLEASVRDSISRYVAGSITADALAQLLPDGWDVDEADEPRTTELVMRVVGYISEYDLDRRSEAELREALRPEASWFVDRDFTTAADVVTTPELETQVRPGAGTAPQVVLVS